MATDFERLTVADECVFEGLGLHSGAPVTVRVLPGQDGIVFRYGSEVVTARPENVTDTSRCTRLGPIATVEHLMSALGGLGLTDAEIEVSAPELPALDGAAGEYVKGLASIGTTTVGTASFDLFERVFFTEDEIRIGIGVGDGRWRFDFESGGRWPHEQSFECALTPKAYSEDVAPARTFAFEEEVGPIREAGLAKGLDLSNALVLGKAGYMNEPIWPDEPARHKMLDLVGDLFLAGVPPTLLNVVATRSGHRTNVEAAKKLADHAKVTR